jgi:3-hydroxyisobutyrate dehydrogenase
MGEPICRNLVKKSGSARARVRSRAGAAGAAARRRAPSRAPSLKSSTSERHRVLCLPSAKHVRAVFEGDGILKNIRKGQVVVDLGTSSVSQTRDFAKQLQARGASWADAPIARTRQAAQDGTLSVMVGASSETFAAIEPLIRCFATDVTHCGDVGAGQVTKILNNMVLFETVNALAEAVAVAKRNGVDPRSARHLVERLRRQFCAAQSRHEGDRAGQFSGTRVLDRIRAEGPVLCALELAAELAGMQEAIRGAELIGKVLQEAIDAGFRGLTRSFPVAHREAYRSRLDPVTSMYERRTRVWV